MNISKRKFLYAIPVVLLLVCIVLLLIRKEHVFHEPGILTVSVRLKFGHDDILRVFYCDKPGESFSSDNTIARNIKGSPEFQEVLFTLPVSRITKLRIDFGNTIVGDQEEIHIENIKIANEIAFQEIDASQLQGFFEPAWIKSMDDSGVITTVRFGDVFNPFIVLKSPDELMMSIGKNNSFSAFDLIITIIIVVAICVLLMLYRSYLKGVIPFIKQRFVYLILICIVGIGLYGLLQILLKPQRTTITVRIKLRFKHDDFLYVLYTDQPDENFSFNKSVKNSIKGSGDFQEIVFPLPVYAMNKMRIDLGTRLVGDEERVDISYIKISNGKKNLQIKGESLSEFFEPAWIKEIDNSGITVAKFDKIFNPFLVLRNPQVLDEDTESINDFSFTAFFLAIMFTAVLGFFVVFYAQPVSAHTVIRISFILLFVLLIFAPLISTSVNLDQNEINLEKRDFAKIPELSASKRFSKDFEKYYSDNFGFRTQLIKWGSLIKVKYFNVPLKPEKVLIGDDNWLFYNNSEGFDYIFNSYTHRNLLLTEDLFDYVQTLEERMSSCEDKGITYIRGVWPQTQSIYPECMPFLMRIQVKDTISKTDQIVTYLKKAKPKIKFVDVRSDIIEHKIDHRLYFKLDSHWNEYGAFIGYQSFLNQTFDILKTKPLSLDSFDITYDVVDDGDLVNMLGVDSQQFTDTIPKFKFKYMVPFEYVAADGLPDRSKITICNACADERTLLVFHDSYNELTEKFFSMHFKKVIYVWTQYRDDVIQSVKPNIVVEMSVERYL